MSVTFEIIVHEGRNLASKDSNGFSDPYVVCSFKNIRDAKSKPEKKKTDFIKKTLNPNWNDQELAFSFNSERTFGDLELEITVWDKDTLSSDDFMGRLEPIKMFDIIQNPIPFAERQWFTLLQDVKMKHKVSGEICISYKYKIPSLGESKKLIEFVKDTNVIGCKQCLLHGAPPNGSPGKASDTNTNRCINNGDKDSFEIMKLLVEHNVNLLEEGMGNIPAITLLGNWSKSSARNEYLELLLSKDAITSDSIIESIKKKPSCVSLSEENKELWKSLSNAGKLDESCLQALSDSENASDLLAWLSSEGIIKPTKGMLFGYIEKDEVENAKKVGDILGSDIEISCKALCSSKSVEMSKVLNSLLEKSSKPIIFEEDDLFAITKKQPFDQNLFDKALENGLSTNSKLGDVSLFGYSIMNGCPPVTDYLIKNDNAIVDENPGQDVYRILESGLTDELQIKYLKFLIEEKKIKKDNLLSIKVATDCKIIPNQPLYNFVVKSSFPVFDYLTTQLFEGNFGNEDIVKDFKSQLLKSKEYGTPQQLEKLAQLNEELVKEIFDSEIKLLPRAKVYCATAAANIEFMSKYLGPVQSSDLFSTSMFPTKEDTLKAMIAQNVDINSTLDGQPLIHKAVMGGNAPLVKVLIERNADLSKRNSHNLSVKQQLEASKPNINAGAFHDISRIFLNFKEPGAEETLSALRQLSNKNIDKAIEIIKTISIIPPGITLDGKNPYELLVTKYSGGDKETELIEELKSRKCDINSENDKGATPLMEACLKGKHQLIEPLIKNNAHTGVVDKDKNNVYHMIAVSGSVECYEAMDKFYSADLVDRDKNIHGHTAGELCRIMLMRGNFSHALLNKKFNIFD